MRVVVSGYVGFGNLGDDAVLAAMLAALRPRMPGAEFVVLSADPHTTARQHDVVAVPRLGAPALRAVSGADLFISGGGSLIQDATSTRSPLYYLGMLAAGNALARRSMVYAQGVGPLRRSWLRGLAGWVGNGVDVVTVRDEDSRRLLEACGVRRPIDVVADPVFALTPAPPERVSSLLGPSQLPRIGVALRPWADNAYAVPLLKALREVGDQLGAEFVVLVFHPMKDRAISEPAAQRLSATLIANVTPEEMLAVIGALDLVIGVRLHALICAVAAGVPSVGLAYDPKIDAFFRLTEAGTVLPLHELTTVGLTQMLSAAWSSREVTRASLRVRLPALQAAALRAADLAATLAGFPSKPTE